MYIYICTCVYTHVYIKYRLYIYLKIVKSFKSNIANRNLSYHFCCVKLFNSCFSTCGLERNYTDRIYKLFLVSRCNVFFFLGCYKQKGEMIAHICPKLVTGFTKNAVNLICFHHGKYEYFSSSYA